MKLQAIAIKEENKPFRIVSAAAFRGQCDSLPLGRYRLTVEKLRKNKSNPQLGYLFACVYPLSMKLLNEAGWEEINTIDKCDAFWKARHANIEITNRDSGEVIKVPALKRDFSSMDMTTYIDAIRNDCAEWLGGYIPGPEEQTNIEFNEESKVTS